MAKKFSRKEFEKMLDNDAKEGKEFWERKKGKEIIERRKQNSFPVIPELDKLNTVIKNFEDKTGQSLTTFFKNLRDEQEKECELILKSMDAYAAKEGLIKPMDKDELAGFYLWLSNQDGFTDNGPDRSTYMEFNNYMKRKIEKKIYKSFEDLFEAAVMNEAIGPYENELVKSAERNRYNFDFNIWLQETKGWEYGNEVQYTTFLTKQNFMNFLDYEDSEKQKNILKQEIEKKSWIKTETEPIIIYYNHHPANFICTDTSKKGIREYEKSYYHLNNHSFQYEIKNLLPDRIAEKLDYHLRYFERKGGNKADWITHTKAMMPVGLTSEQKDAYLTWIENNEKVLIIDKKDENINWKQFIKPELYERLVMIEVKIESKISLWKQRKALIECAAFCQLLFDKKYFTSNCTSRISVNSFALSKYGTDINIQLGSAKKKDRDTHKKQLNRHFN